MTRPRRLVISVCPREPGVVRLPITRGARRRRLGAPALLEALGALVTARGLGDRVTLREACAGGCWSPGPNVSVVIHPLSAPGEPADGVALGWKTYVYSLPALDCLARVIDENL
ncbi:MAG: hypothetical protein HY216_12485 [Candidatus Rokubacteria bacterium]|nr:hypothetical protein [Candidatus Rokubacteria bacterium]